jgi:hypothetical protein
MVLLLCALLASPGFGAGVLKISNSLITIEPGGHRAAIILSNNGDRPLYLDVVQQQVLNPGELPEKRVLVQDVALPDLLVPVRQVLLRPGHTQKIPLNVVYTPGQARVWRVAFRNREKVTGAEAGQESFIQLNVSYGVLIYHMAKPGEKSWERKRKGE